MDRVEMAHKATSMARVEYPCEGLGHDVGRVDFAGDMCHINDTRCFPVLDSEEWNSNVPRAFCRDAGRDYLDSRIVIFIDQGRTGLREAKVREDRSEIANDFGHRDCGIEFCFGRAKGGLCLCLRAVHNCSASEHDGEAGSGLAFRFDVSKGSVNEARNSRSRW